MVLPNLAGAYLALFTTEFLQLREYEKTLWKLNQTFAFVSLCLALSALPISIINSNLEQIFLPVSGIVGLCSTIIIVWATVKSLVHGRAEALYFLTATAVFFVSVVIKILANFHIIPLSSGAYYSVTVGFAVQLILFSFALADRIRTLHQVIQQTQEQAIKAEAEARIEHQRNEALELAQAEIVRQKVKLEDQNMVIEASNIELQQINETLLQQQHLLQEQRHEAEEQRKEMEQAHKEMLSREESILRQRDELAYQKLVLEVAHNELIFANESIKKQKIELEEKQETIEAANTKLQAINAELVSREESILRQRDELAYQKLVLEVAHNELIFANESIKKQKTELEEKQETIEAANIELQTINTELLRQKQLLEEQTVETEMLNTELHERNQELRSLSEERSELLGIVSHDLKNPIASIQGLAEILMTGDNSLTVKQREQMIQLILHNANKMNNLVKNLLDAHAIEQGNLIAQLQETRLNDIVEQVLMQYHEQALQKELRILFHNDAAVTVLADEQLLTQIVDNLISNAVKYSPRGKTIQISVTEYSPNTGLDDGVVILQRRFGIQNIHHFGKEPLGIIIVRDEGAGIPPEEMPRLFGKFARLSTRPTEGEDSTGLGLSIVKKFVQKMNGEVWCESEQGKGSVFIITLPLFLTNESPRIPQAA